MAINKNFVVKNGLEVNTDLILADADRNKVGIGSTIPKTELDVIGGIAATNLSITGIATISSFRAVNGITSNFTSTNIFSGVTTTIVLNSTNISNIGVITSQNLNISGIGTIASGVITDINGTNLNYSGLGTIYNLKSSFLEISGFSTFIGGIIVDNANVSGVATISSVEIGSGDIQVNSIRTNNLNSSGISTLGTTYISDGDVQLTSLRTSNLNATGVSTIASLFVTGSTLDTLTVNNYSNLSGIVTIGNLNVTGISTFNNDVYLRDNNHLYLGNSNDLQIYHDGFNSYIRDFGVGDILIQGGNSIQIQNSGGTETKAIFSSNGSVSLYYDNSNKFQTAGAGITVFGTTSTDQLNVTGISTLSGIKINSGIITASSGIVTYYGDGGNLLNLPGASPGGSDTQVQYNNGGIFDGNSNFVFDGNTVTVGGNLKLNSTGINIPGILTATSFVGDGSGLTNVGVSTDNIKTSTPANFLSSVRVVGFTTLASSSCSNFNVTGILTASTLNYTVSRVGSAVTINNSGISVAGIITASNFVGNGSGLTNVGASISDDNSTDDIFYPIFTQNSSGTLTNTKVSSSKLSYNPSTGALTVVDLNSTSDINLKTNIETINSATKIISNIRGVSFDWRETGKSSYGVIAQEIEKFLPELVNGENIKTVNYNGLIGILIEAVKNLSERIERLENA